jgi:hypothetical protein
VNLKKKCIYMLTWLLKGVLKLKIFWLRIFWFAPGVNTTSDAPSAANISVNFRKNFNGSKWDTLVLGKTDSWKNLKSKILCHCPFKEHLLLLRNFPQALSLFWALSLTCRGRDSMAMPMLVSKPEKELPLAFRTPTLCCSRPRLWAGVIIPSWYGKF